MKLSGEAMLQAGVDEVYAGLTDPALLVRAIPGCQRLEQTGPDTYKATVSAGVASIKGTFDGEVRLSDRVPPHSFTLHASGAGAPGTVTAVARVALAPADGGGTALRYDADATIGGVIGGVGQRMISGVARRTAGDFFAAVDRELAGVPVAAPSVAVEEPTQVVPVAEAEPTRVWSAPVTAVDPARQRVRELVLAAAFGAVVALLGVIVGAIVAGW